MERPRPPIAGESAQRRREIGGEGRLAALVVDERQRLVGVRRQAQDQLDHVVAVLAAHPRRACDRGRRARGVLAGQLRAAVDRHRVGGVVLTVRTVEGAVEHVVGADVHEVGADEFTGRRQVAHGVGAHGEGQGLVGLARVDGGVGRGVDDRIGTNRVEQRANGVDVGDVEIGLGDADHLVTGGTCMVDEVDAELASGAGHEQLHGSIGGGGPTPRK